MPTAAATTFSLHAPNLQTTRNVASTSSLSPGFNKFGAITRTMPAIECLASDYRIYTYKRRYDHPTASVAIVYRISRVQDRYYMHR